MNLSLTWVLTTRSGLQCKPFFVTTILPRDMSHHRKIKVLKAIDHISKEKGQRSLKTFGALKLILPAANSALKVYRGSLFCRIILTICHGGSYNMLDSSYSFYLLQTIEKY